MKKLKNIIYITGVLILLNAFCYFVNSSTTAKIILDTNKSTIKVGETVELTVKVQQQKTAAFHFNLYFDNTKLDFVSGEDNINVIDNRIIHVWYDETGGKNPKKGNLATFKFKAKENGKVTFGISGEFYSDASQLIKTDYIEADVQIGKEETILQKQSKEEQGDNTQTSNVSLKTLRLDKEGIVPEFNSGIYQYYLIVPQNVKDLEVLAIPENPDSKVEVTGNNNLKNGLNTINIKVISENNKQNKNYKINVTKTSDLEKANTNLETLAIQNILLNPPFDTNITQYNIEVSNDVNNLNILAIPQNENAKVEIKGKDNLKEGENQIKIIVIAQNGYTKREYIINAHKRTIEEEKEYEKEQKENTEKLEEIYEAEKASSDVNNEVAGVNNEQEGIIKKEEKNNLIKIAVLVILCAIIILFTIYYIKRIKQVRK